MNAIGDAMHHVSTPLQPLHWPEADARGVRLWVKRDDLLRTEEAPAFCGNKWRKLKHNLLAAEAQGLRRLLTFGGAYSNHIAATAAAGHWLGWPTVGVIRGEPHTPLNPVLHTAVAQGMHLHYLDRATYRAKHTPEVLGPLLAQYGPCYAIPEGGTNALALQGCVELAAEVQAQCAEAPPTHLLVACGTGGTAAGLVAGTPAHTQVVGVAVLRGGFLVGEVARHLAEAYPARHFAHWTVLDGYHRGGYAKQDAALLQCMAEVEERDGVCLEPIYTGKLFMACQQLLMAGFFPVGSRVVLVHTGGVAGHGRPRQG